VWLAGKLTALIAWMGDGHILKAGTLVSVKRQAVINLHVINRVTSILTNAALDHSTGDSQPTNTSFHHFNQTEGCNKFLQMFAVFATVTWWQNPDYKNFYLTLRWLMSYIYGAPILDVSRSHTMTQHSR